MIAGANEPTYKRLHRIPEPPLPGYRARRGGRAAEGAPLLREYTGDRIVGSNPILSATFAKDHNACHVKDTSWSL